MERSEDWRPDIGFLVHGTHSLLRALSRALGATSSRHKAQPSVLHVHVMWHPPSWSPQHSRCWLKQCPVHWVTLATRGCLQPNGSCGSSCTSSGAVTTGNSCSLPPQADVTGLCWVRYSGPTSTTLETPRDDPVLNTYAKLLNEG